MLWPSFHGLLESLNWLEGYSFPRVAFVNPLVRCLAIALAVGRSTFDENLVTHSVKFRDLWRVSDCQREYIWATLPSGTWPYDDPP